MEASRVKKTSGIEAESTALTIRAKSFGEITNAGQYDELSRLGREVKTMQKAVIDHHEPMRLKTKAAYDSVLEAKAKMLGPLEAAERVLKALGGSWLRREEQRRREEEARALSQRKREEEDARVNQAEALEEAGEHAEAEAIVSAPVNVAPTIVEKPKAEGVASRKVWKYRVIDESAIPDEWFALDEKRLAAYIRHVGDKANIPGIVIYEDVSMAIKSY